MRKAAVTVLCGAAFVASALTLPLHVGEVLAAGWTDWTLGYLLAIALGLPAMLLCVGLVPWLPERTSKVMVACSCLFALPAAMVGLHAVVVFEPPVDGAPGLEPATTWGMLLPSWFGRGEVIGAGPILLALSAALLVRRCSTGSRGRRLWLATWGIAVVLAIWWPWALFTTKGDPVVAMAWFIYYGPTSLLLVLALPLWQAARSRSPSSASPEAPSTAPGKRD